MKKGLSPHLHKKNFANGPSTSHNVAEFVNLQLKHLCFLEMYYLKVTLSLKNTITSFTAKCSDGM